MAYYPKGSTSIYYAPSGSSTASYCSYNGAVIGYLKLSLNPDALSDNTSFSSAALSNYFKVVANSSDPVSSGLWEALNDGGSPFVDVMLRLTDGSSPTVWGNLVTNSVWSNGLLMGVIHSKANTDYRSSCTLVRMLKSTSTSGPTSPAGWWGIGTSGVLSAWQDTATALAQSDLLLESN